MNVDKAHFLLLTAALSAATAVAGAASGCSATSDAKDGGATSPTQEDGGQTDAGSDGSTSDGSTADGGACLDDTGPAPTCTGAADPTCKTVCDSLTASYKNGVARAIGDCILQLPSCEGPPDLFDACVYGALAKACPDPTAEGYCTPLSTACVEDGGATTLTNAACVKVAQALTPAGRTSFESCIHGNTPDTTVCVADPLRCAPP